MSKKPSVHSEEYHNTFQSVLSDDLRAALNSYAMLEALFYTEHPEGLTLPAELEIVLHEALFSSFVTAVGRLMDRDEKSVSICTAMRNLEKYRPDENHLQDLWKVNFNNWKYNSSTREAELVEPTQKDNETLLRKFSESIPALRKECQALFVLYTPLHAWRNKRLAHSDWNQHIGQLQLPELVRDQVSKFLLYLKEFVEKICGKLFMCSIDTDSRWGREAGKQILDLAYRHYRASKIQRFLLSSHCTIDDKNLFLQGYRTNWETIGSSLWDRADAQ